MDGDVKLDGGEVTIVGDKLNINASEISSDTLIQNIGKTRTSISKLAFTVQGIGGVLQYTVIGDFSASHVSALSVTATETLAVKDLKLGRKVDINIDPASKKKKSVDTVNLTDLLSDMLDQIRFLPSFRMRWKPGRRCKTARRPAQGSRDAENDPAIKEFGKQMAKSNKGLWALK